MEWSFPVNASTGLYLKMGTLTDVIATAVLVDALTVVRTKRYRSNQHDVSVAPFRLLFFLRIVLRRNMYMKIYRVQQTFAISFS